MKVEARYRGKSRYYPGKISRDNRDGTYDINYDDGEREMGVREELIRSSGRASRIGPDEPRDTVESPRRTSYDGDRDRLNDRDRFDHREGESDRDRERDRERDRDREHDRDRDRDRFDDRHRDRDRDRDRLDDRGRDWDRVYCPCHTLHQLFMITHCITHVECLLTLNV